MKKFNQIDKRNHWKEIYVTIKGKMVASGKKRLDVEREYLLCGEKPKSIFSNRQQKAAARLLSGFFVMMLVFTLLSRMATSLIIAKVTTDTAKAGVLTKRYIVSGIVEAKDTIDVVLPGNLRISNVMVQIGEYINTGDEILKLDSDGIQTVIEKLEDEIHILNVKIENLSNGISSVDTERIQLAENNLRYAQEDYERLLYTLEMSKKRIEEDLKDAQNNYAQKQNALENAKIKAKDELIRTAQYNLDIAEKTLRDMEYNRTEAILTAENTLATVEDAQALAQDIYDNEIKVLRRARVRLKEAKEHQDSLSEDATEEERTAAKNEVDAARSEVNNAQLRVDEAENNLSGEEVAWASENLKRIKERQNQLVLEARDAVEEAKEKLEKAKEQNNFDEEALVVTAQTAVDSAQIDLKMVMRDWEDASFSQEEQILMAKRSIESAASELKAAKEQAEKAKRVDVAMLKQNEAEQMQYNSELRQKQRILEEMKILSTQNGVITSPTDGIVKSVVEVGVTQDNEAVVTLFQADQKFQFIANVEQEIANQLSVGDMGTLSYVYEGSPQSIQVQISSIGIPNVDGQVHIVVQIGEGSFSNGIAGTLELEKNSVRYQTVLPISALRIMGNKTVVLVIREKQSVMGMEQTVEEVDSLRP